MTGQMETKVRYVRCPKCRLVLQEPTDVPLYKCGGCATVLQAKHWKKGAKERKSQGLEVDITRKTDLQNVSAKLSADESNLDRIVESESGMDGRKERLASLTEPDQLPCSDAISHLENAASSPEARAHMEVEEDKFSSDQCGRKDHGNSVKNDGDISSSNEILLSPELDHQENESLLPGSQPHENESLELSPKDVAASQYLSENEGDGGDRESKNVNQEQPINGYLSNEISSFDVCIFHEIEDPLEFGGADKELDENVKSPSLYRSPSAETFEDINTKDQMSAAHSSTSESGLSDKLMAPGTESMKQPQNATITGSQPVSSDDTLESVPRVYAKGELGVTLRSPTARNYYSYDGGASSSNETDNQVPRRHYHQFKRNSKDAGSNSSGGLPKRDIISNQVTNNELELQHRQLNSTSILRGKKHPPTKGSRWHQEEFLEPTRHRHPVRSAMRIEKNEYQSRQPFNSNAFRADYTNVSSSGYVENNFSENLDKSLETDRLELLKMVYELQDQLNRMGISKEMPHARFSNSIAKKEGNISTYNNHFATKRKNYPDLNNYMGPAIHSPEIWLQQGKVSKIGFFSPYHSASSSPQHDTASEFSLRSRDTKSDDQRHHNHEVKKKHHIAKQHFRPVAGGAPIIACYSCSEVLQLPADFFLIERRFQRLKCSNCSEVLKLSVKNKTHIIQYSPIPLMPPPNEVDNHSDETKERNLASASRAVGHPHAESVSYSDDYNQSFCRSYSTGDNFTTAEVSDHKKLSPQNSLQHKKDGKKKSVVVEESAYKYGNPVECSDAAEPSTKMSRVKNYYSESEVESPLSHPALHQLMGYSSVSRLVYN